jgi:hypothetical protein
MRNAFVFALLAVALACSHREGEQTGPSPIPPSSPSPTPPAPTPPPSRVVLSGTVYASENGLPIPTVSVQIVDGVNTGRRTISNDGNYQLADLEPGTFTLQFTNREYRDLQRTEVVQADTTLNIQLERKGLTLSGRITTQWGEPIGDAGVEAHSDSGARGGAGGETSHLGPGTYRIPTLPPADYVVHVIKWGYVDPRRPLTLTRDTTLDFVLDRVRVSLLGSVREAAPACGGAIEGARVEIVSGPDAGVGVTTTATGYQTTRIINWGKLTLRASKTGYVPAEMSIELLPPGWSCGTLPRPPESPSCPPGQIEASRDVRQDFVLQRTGSC